METHEILGLECLFSFSGTSSILDVLFPPAILVSVSQRTSVSVFLSSRWLSTAVFLLSWSIPGEMVTSRAIVSLTGFTSPSPPPHVPSNPFPLPVTPSRKNFRAMFHLFFPISKSLPSVEENHLREKSPLTSSIVFSFSWDTFKFVHQSLNLAWAGAHSCCSRVSFSPSPLLSLSCDPTAFSLSLTFMSSGVNYLSLLSLLAM